MTDTLPIRINFLLNPLESELEKTKSKSFSKEVSNTVIIAEDLAGCKKCKICGSRLQHKAISKDHIIKKEHEGDGNITNLQITHPYCNTEYKNWLEHQQKLKSVK